MVKLCGERIKPAFDFSPDVYTTLKSFDSPLYHVTCLFMYDHTSYEHSNVRYYIDIALLR